VLTQQVVEVDVQYLFGQYNESVNSPYGAIGTRPLPEETHVRASRLRLDRLDVLSGPESLLVSCADFATYLMSKAHKPEVARWMGSVLR
jgi:hypothetical protein